MVGSRIILVLTVLDCVGLFWTVLTVVGSRINLVWTVLTVLGSRIIFVWTVFDCVDCGGV